MNSKPSSLVGGQVRDWHDFNDIILSFIVRLDEQLEAIDSALSAGDFEQLAQLAHWLKGSAGSLGFGSFTAPASLLEKAAHAKEMQESEENLLLIRELRRRIANPSMADTGTHKG